MGHKIKHFLTIMLLPLALVLFNVAVLKSWISPILRIPFSFLFLFFLPGYLILRIINIQHEEKQEKFFLSVILSISFVTIVGLIFNTALPYLGIKRPLDVENILPWFTGVLIVMYFYLVKAKLLNFELKGRFQRFNPIDLLGYFLPMLALGFSIAGATIINNGGGNLLSYAVVVSIFILVVSTIIAPRLYLNAFTVYAISLSLQYLYSLRSWYVLGYDINQELRIFNLTKAYGHWDLGILKEAYNTCLSINLLPAILTDVAGISENTFFKLVIPAISCLTVALIYLMGKKFIKPQAAFLGAFFFSVQNQFLQQMPALGRQSVAITFFTLAIYSLFIGKPLNRKRDIIYILAIISMVLSHYSTTYVGTVSIIAAYFVLLLLKVLTKDYSAQRLTLSLVVITFTIAFLWNTLLTENVKGLEATLRKSVHNISTSFTSDMKSETVKKALFISEENKDEILQEFYSKTKEKYAPLPERVVDGYEPYIIDTDSLLPIFDYPMVTRYFGMALPIFFRLALLAGVLIMGILLIKGKLEREYSAFSIVFLGLVILMLVLPSVSVDYNLERLYQQGLILLSMPIVIGALFFFKSLGERFSMVLVSFVIFSYLLLNIGIIERVFNGTPSVIFENMGGHYDRYYVSAPEVAGAKRLQKFINSYDLSITRSDRYGFLRVLGYTNLSLTSFSSDVFPETLQDGSYVYLSKTNVQKSTAYGLYKDYVFSYNYPIKYLDLQKDLLYSNNSSRIYRGAPSEN